MFPQGLKAYVPCVAPGPTDNLRKEWIDIRKKASFGLLGTCIKHTTQTVKDYTQQLTNFEKILDSTDNNTKTEWEKIQASINKMKKMRELLKNKRKKTFNKTLHLKPDHLSFPEDLRMRNNNNKTKQQTPRVPSITTAVSPTPTTTQQTPPVLSNTTTVTPIPRIATTQTHQQNQNTIPTAKTQTTTTRPQTTKDKHNLSDKHITTTHNLTDTDLTNATNTFLNHLPHTTMKDTRHPAGTNQTTDPTTCTVNQTTNTNTTIISHLPDLGAKPTHTHHQHLNQVTFQDTLTSPTHTMSPPRGHLRHNTTNYQDKHYCQTHHTKDNGEHQTIPTLEQKI